MDQPQEPPPQDAVAAALAQIRAAAGVVIAARLWAFTDSQALAHVEEGQKVKAVLEAANLALIGDLDGRDDAVSGARAGRGAALFLKERCRRSRAHADVRAARMVKDADLLADRCAAAGIDTPVPDDPSDGTDGLDELDGSDGVERGDLAGLPRLGLALRAGQVSRDHLDAAVRAVTQIPKRLLDEPCPVTGRSGWQRADDLLTGHARAFDPATSEALAHELRNRLDPDTERGFDPDGHLRRQFTMTTHADGMTTVRGTLDPASAAVVKKTIEHYAKPWSTHHVENDDGHTLPIVDTRTKGQRYADSLTAACRAALAAPDAGIRGGEPALITVHTTMEELRAAALERRSDPDRHGDGNGDRNDDRDCDSKPAAAVTNAFTAAQAAHQPQPGQLCPHDRAATGAHSPQLGPIGPELLARYACDAIIETVIHTKPGAVLDLGRSSRTHSAAQRRAVIARDRGCLCCGAPPERCQLHHVHWWSTGGPTDIDNLALLLCDADHTKIHLGIYDIRIRDGVPWIRPPRWIDPHRHWYRGRPPRETHARTQTRQLALDLTTDTCPDDHPTRGHGPPAAT